MKKIVAVVLSLVMVLGLATTAFAAADKYDMYKADDGMAAAMKLDAPTFGDVEIAEYAAKTNKDGSGNVAYVMINGGYYVKNAAPTVDSFAVTEAGKTTVLYYLDFVGVNNVFSYTASATKFNNFGLKCGQVAVVPAPAATDVYFQTAAGVVYKAEATTGTDATKNYLVDGKVYTAPAVAETVIDHTFVANNYKYDTVLQKNVPTSAICTTCLMTSSAIYLDGKAPAGSTVKELTSDQDYCVVVGATASAPSVDGDKVESAETFDAGIAMYVGMSVMAAAGSAVVLKKKD